MHEEKLESLGSSVCRWEDRDVVAGTFRISVYGCWRGFCGFALVGLVSLYSAVGNLIYRAPSVAIIAALYLRHTRTSLSLVTERTAGNRPRTSQT